MKTIIVHTVKRCIDIAAIVVTITIIGVVHLGFSDLCEHNYVSPYSISIFGLCELANQYYLLDKNQPIAITGIKRFSKCPDEYFSLNLFTSRTNLESPPSTPLYIRNRILII